MIQFGIISIFPEFFDTLLSCGVVARAAKRKLIACHFFNPRDYTDDNYRTIDDRPFGGGPGMVMLYEPLSKAIQASKAMLGDDVPVIYLSPQGKPYTQENAKDLALTKSVILLCGRYEGIDQRVIDKWVDDEISIGDYVLSGGELAAAVMVDSMTRLIPGALNHHLSSKEDSFFDGLLDCPHYTRPQTLASGETTPEVLVSGNHAEINRWRDMMKLGLTYEKRPELIKRRCLSDYEKRLLKKYSIKYKEDK